MKIVIRNAVIVDPHSPHNGQILDIFVENGHIRQIGESLDIANSDQEVRIDGIHVSPGWVDVFSHFNDPGFEFRETLESGAAAAAAGGYTDVFVIPNTDPVIHSKSQSAYVVEKSRRLPVNIHPIGAITKDAQGKELAEMYDMAATGAIAFSDGLEPLQSAGVLLKALQYVKACNATIIQVPEDLSIQPHGLMHEGIVSTRLGLPGIPAMAEEIMIARDLKLARYADSKIHFTAISSAKSLEYIRRGKEGGIGVSCSVTPYHLFFCDEDLMDYDTNLKLNPPVRSKADREALCQAVIDGTIDCIASHHQPHDFDGKIREFQYAKYGMIGLETVYAVLNTAIPALTPEACIHMLSINPRRLFGLPSATIDRDAVASLTLFVPGEKWTPTLHDFRSLSKNSPFIGKELSGRVKGIINKDQLFLTQ